MMSYRMAAALLIGLAFASSGALAAAPPPEPPGANDKVITHTVGVPDMVGSFIFIAPTTPAVHVKTIHDAKHSLIPPGNLLAGSFWSETAWKRVVDTKEENRWRAGSVPGKRVHALVKGHYTTIVEGGQGQKKGGGKPTEPPIWTTMSIDLDLDADTARDGTANLTDPKKDAVEDPDEDQSGFGALVGSGGRAPLVLRQVLPVVPTPRPQGVVTIKRQSAKGVNIVRKGTDTSIFKDPKTDKTSEDLWATVKDGELELEMIGLGDATGDEVLEAEYRNAGPDKKLGNTDDLVFTDKINISIFKVEIKRDVAGGAVNYVSLTSALRKVLPGQQMNLKAEVTPIGLGASRYQWALPGKVFRDWTANQTRATLTPVYPDTLIGETVRYYWVDTGNPQEVQCKVTVSGVECLAKEAFNVEKPTASFTATQGTVKKVVEGGVDRLKLTPAATKANGIEWVGKVAVPSGYAQGKWNFVQIITDGLHRVTGAGAKEYGNNFGHFVLDNTYPYEPAPYTSHPGTAGSYATGATSQTQGDTPSTALTPATLKSKGTHDKFKTFVMFLPPGDDARYVPLRKIEWEWQGDATNAGGTWTAVAGSLKPNADQNIASAEATEHPVWPVNWVPFSWNSGPVAVNLTVDKVKEGDGKITGKASVSVTDNVAAKLTVNLASSATGRLTVPASVDILAGKNSADFDFTVVDNSVADGTESVRITATAAGYGSGEASLVVEDNDGGPIVVTISPNRYTEGAGTISGKASVTLPGNVDPAVTVNLVSGNTGKVAVTATVTVPKGSKSVTFDFAIVDNKQKDGTVRALITASAPGYLNGDAAVIVDDND